MTATAELGAVRARRHPSPPMTPAPDELARIVRELEITVATQAEAFRHLEQIVAGFEATGREVWSNTRDVIELRNDVAELRGELAGAVSACQALTDRLTTASDQRLVSRATIVVAGMGASGTVLAAVLPSLLSR